MSFRLLVAREDSENLVQSGLPEPQCTISWNGLTRRPKYKKRDRADPACLFCQSPHLFKDGRMPVRDDFRHFLSPGHESTFEFIENFDANKRALNEAIRWLNMSQDDPAPYATALESFAAWVRGLPEKERTEPLDQLPRFLIAYSRQAKHRPRGTKWSQVRSRNLEECVRIGGASQY